MFSTRSSRRGSDSKAAKRLLVGLLKKQGLAPKRIFTDKLRSYGAARRDVMSAAPSKKGTNDAGISICRRLVTFHLSHLSSPKSLRPAAPETLSPRHPHSSDPRKAQWNAAAGGLFQPSAWLTRP